MKGFGTIYAFGSLRYRISKLIETRRTDMHQLTDIDTTIPEMIPTDTIYRYPWFNPPTCFTPNRY